jgi:hypothetical protein
MSQQNGTSSPGAGERSPLLVQQRIYDDSSETLSASQGGEEEEESDIHKANQQVGRRRGILIILSLWGLIFLQGKFPHPGSRWRSCCELVDELLELMVDSCKHVFDHHHPIKNCRRLECLCICQLVHFSLPCTPILSFT